MKRKIYHLFDYAHIKVIVVIIILILPLNIIAIKQNTNSVAAINEQAKLSMQNLADNYMSEVYIQMQNTQSILARFLQEDVDCIVMQEQAEDEYKYESAKMRFYYNLKTTGGLINGADGYFYYMEKKEDMLAWGKAVTGDNILQTMESFVVGEIDNSKSQGWHIYELNSKQYLLLIMNRKNISYGAWLNLDDVYTQIQKGIDYSEYTISFDEGEVIESEKDTIQILSQKKNIILNIVIPTRETIAKISGYQKLMQIMVFIYLVLVPVLYFFLRHMFIIPLKKINEAHAHLQNGEPDYRLSETGSSAEFQEVYISFNQMAENIKLLKIESYEAEIARQKMELRNLQLQIRPHFLLNTFNLIYTLIQRKEYNLIQDVVLYLSDYFRYIFRTHKELELFSKELQIIQNYVKLSGIRYLGSIDFKYELDPELEFIRIPPLLLHNFVENSIKYGMKKGQILQITIIGEYEERMVTIYIIDDGNGLNETQLEHERKILGGEVVPENPNAHIGLLNSYKRLKYFYGETSKIEIESEPGKLTCFKICFPYDLEEENEIIDSQ